MFISNPKVTTVAEINARSSCSFFCYGGLRRTMLLCIHSPRKPNPSTCNYPHCFWCFNLVRSYSLFPLQVCRLRFFELGFFHEYIFCDMRVCLWTISDSLSTISGTQGCVYAKFCSKFVVSLFHFFQIAGDEELKFCKNHNT